MTQKRDMHLHIPLFSRIMEKNMIFREDVDNMTVAILTGASAGLGQSFFQAMCANGPQVDEIWLIARRRERLEEMAASAVDCKVRVLPLDLTVSDSFVALRELLEQEKPDVRALINNAGFGKMGYVEELDPVEQGGMVDLNVRALTVLSAMVLPYMQKGAFVLNVCSIASFVPNPRMTVYSSTKAYVLSFSKGLREEVKKRGVNVLALCPGPMRTEFLPVAGIAAGSSKTFDTLPYACPDRVAVLALKKARQGRAVFTPLGFFKFYRVLAKLLPHNWLMKLAKV